MQRPDWKNSVMREWKRPPTMIVHGLYPLISRVSVAERSMIVLLVIEYLCSMLPEDLSVTMEGPWFSHGDLDDLVCMAATVAYRLMPDASRLVQFVDEVFHQAIQSCRAREEVLGRFQDCTEGTESVPQVPQVGAPPVVEERVIASRVPAPPSADPASGNVPLDPKLMNPFSARHRINADTAAPGPQNDGDRSPPFIPEPVPGRRSMFVESERRDMSTTPSWMYQCDECGGAFTDPDKLRHHREQVHSAWPAQRPVVNTFRPTPNPSRPNPPVIRQPVYAPSASPEVAQIQSQISALSSMMTQMQSMLSGREGTEGADERPLAQRRSRRTNAGAALCKECNFPTKFCECDLSADSDVEVRSSTRKGNGGRARNALSSIAGLPLSDIFKRHRVLLVPEMWLPYFASGAQPRDLRAALEARYVTDKRFDNHETIKANNRHMIESIMLAITAALMPMEFERPPNELDTPSLMHSMRYLQENRVRAQGGEKAAQAYRETVENDSGPEDERRAEAAGAKVSAKAEELRQTSRYKPESVDKPEGKKGQYKRSPDAQWQKMTAAEKTAWRKNNPL